MNTIIKSPEIGEDLVLQAPYNLMDMQDYIEANHAEKLIDLNYSSQVVIAPMMDEDNSSAKETDQKLALDLVEQQRVEDWQAIEDRAEKEGYKHGYLQGEIDGKQKYAEAIQALTQLIDSGKTSVSSVLEDVQVLIETIVFEAVCKILGEKLVTKDGCRGVVGQIISGLQHDDILSIRVSSEDYERLQLQVDELLQDKSVSHALPFEKDESVKLGGCVVKLKDGLVDASIETQLQLFSQSLKKLSGRA